MILERFLLAVLITAVAFGSYQLFQLWHRWRISGRPAGQADGAMLLYFHGDSCAACPTQTRFVEQVGQRFTAGLHIRKIDAEREPETAAEYGIFSLPTTVVVDPHGHVQYINYGLTNAQQLAQQVEKFL